MSSDDSATRGTPGGIPKRDMVAETARKVFEENPKVIYRAMLKWLEGEIRAVRLNEKSARRGGISFRPAGKDTGGIDFRPEQQ